MKHHRKDRHKEPYKRQKPIEYDDQIDVLIGAIEKECQQSPAPFVKPRKE